MREGIPKRNSFKRQIWLSHVKRNTPLSSPLHRTFYLPTPGILYHSLYCVFMWKWLSFCGIRARFSGRLRNLPPYPFVTAPPPSAWGRFIHHPRLGRRKGELNWSCRLSETAFIPPLISFWNKKLPTNKPNAVVDCSIIFINPTCKEGKSFDFNLLKAWIL